MSTTLKNHHKAAAIIICLMVHSIIIVTLMIIEMQNPDREPIILIADSQQEQGSPEDTTFMQPLPQEEWVAMSNAMPNSSFVAAPAAPATQEISNAAVPEVAEAAEEKIDQSPPDTHAMQDTPQDLLEDPAPVHRAAIEKSIDEVLELATQFMEERAPQEQNPKEQEKVESSPAEKIESKLEKFSQKDKQITLAQIAQGFVTQLQQAPASQDGGMTVDSDKQGKASMSQLQQLHYCQKVIGCIVNSYKINRFNAPGVQQENRLCVHLALKKDGSIHTLRIVQSSGSSMLDQFVLATFKDASSSFPPLPQTFKQIPYHLPFFNIDRVESLQTTQGWYIDNRHS